jgi:phage terminase large subunit
MATDLAGPGYHINRSNLLVLESKADMQKRGQASPDDGDALALTFADTWQKETLKG